MGKIKVNEIEKHDATEVTVNSDVVMAAGTSVSSPSISTDTISEKTSASGVTVDGVLLKDNAVNTDTISEKTSGSGVTIDGVLVKDGQVDGKDVSSLVSAGLVLIDNYSFSAVTTFSRDNVFSSTYKNYLFQMNMDSASVTTDTNINFRASSSDYTSATYDWSVIYNVSSSSTVAVTRASNDTKLNGFAYMESTGSGNINSYIIANPNETKTTTITGTANRFSGTDVVLGLFGGSTGVTNSFDGYTVTRISGTMTGSVKIFGLIDS